MRELLSAAADLLFGASCPGCDTPGLGWCRNCWAAVCNTPVRLDRGLAVPLMAAANYRPLLCRAIPRHKDDAALYLARSLSRLLARSVAALEPPRSAVLVPVPSLNRIVVSRGYDHCLALARGAGRILGMKATPQLSRSRSGGDQRGLNRSSRAANLEGSMRCRGTPGEVVVVDDVVTTGASLREAIRALRTGGATVIGAAVIANADRCAISLTGPFPSE